MFWFVNAAVSLDSTICVNCVNLEIAWRAPKWRSRLLAASCDAAVLVTGVREQGWAWGEGLNFKPGWSHHFPPSQIPARCLWLLQQRSQEGEAVGKALMSSATHGPGHKAEHRAISAASPLAQWPHPALEGLCFLLPSSCMGLPFPVWHLLLSTSEIAALQGWVRWQDCSVHAVSLQEAQLFHEDFYRMCICISEEQISSAILERI